MLEQRNRRALPAILLALSLLPISPASAQSCRGKLSVHQPWSRATSARATIGGGYLTLRNACAAADRLIAATSPRAARVEIHTMDVTNGVMRMRPVANGVAIGAGSELRFAPGGYHLMLLGLRSPLKSGDVVPVTLRFEKAGAVDAILKVGTAGAAGPITGSAVR